MDANIGIYAIEQKDTGKVYIGSAANFLKRWRIHQCLLRKGKHHSAHLQSAWNKYGETAFVFKKLIMCGEDLLIFFEQRAIDVFHAADREHGFNARSTAESMLGYKHTEAAKEKVRAARAKQMFSQETRALWSKQRTGRKMPEGFAEAARQWKLGNKHTAEAKAKISAGHMGIPQSAETRALRQGKLSIEQAEEIKALYASGEYKQKELAAKFEVDPSMINRIVHNKRWNLN